MLLVDRVSKSFGSVQAVREVSVEVRQGEVTGLLGPNGAGKTTLIRMITAFHSPTAGRISVCGHDTIDDSAKARSCLGYLPESAPLYPEMSVRGYLTYRARLFGVPRTDRAAAIRRAIERCWLTDMTSRRIGQLSKGYRQRVGLAAAILHDPQVLVLDEPTSGLDPTQIREMRSLIRELASGRVVLVSSHILPEVEQTCDRVLIIARGRLRADGSPQSLLGPWSERAAYEVELAAADTATAQRLLAAVPGAQSVDSSGPGRFVIIPHSNAGDLREPIARAAAGAGLLIKELHRREPTLEQVFMDVIAKD